jgi:zinc protease
MTRTIEQIRHTPAGPRTIPPVQPTAPTQIPRALDTVLANGLRVVLVRHASTPTVHLRLSLPLAPTDHRDYCNAGVLAHTLFAGTERRNRSQVDTDMARAGGNVYAAAAIERLTISGAALASGFDTLMDVTVDALTGALHHDNEVNSARQIFLQHVEVNRSDPQTVASVALRQHCFGDHPITKGLPPQEQIAAVTAEDVQALHRDTIVPDGAIMVLVGAFDLDKALADVEHVTRRWSSPNAGRLMPPLPKITGRPIAGVHHQGATQSQVRLTAQAVPHTDPRFPALLLANLALGSGYAARLVEVLRERMALCYAANSELEIHHDVNGFSSTLNVALDTATATTADAMRALRGELARFRIEPPDQAELERVRGFAIGSQALTVMSQPNLADTVAGLLNAGLDVEWLAIHREQLAAVTLDEVAEAGREFLDPARFTGVIVGDRDLLASPLAESFTEDDGIQVS